MEPVIYIIDDDIDMVNSIIWILDSVKLTIKSFSNPKEFLNSVDLKKHGCILVDVRIPIISGLELQNRLNKMGSKLPIIFISGYSDPILVAQVMKKGAIDYLPKPFNDQHLLESVNRAIQIDNAYRMKQIETEEIKSKFDLLSLREIQVLYGIMEGNQNKLISNQLKISLKTVEAHRASMMKKLGVKNILQLAKLMLSQDIQDFLFKNKKWNFCVNY